MENFKEPLDELELLDPLEWHNIPQPIVNGIVSLKNCIKQQSSYIESLNKTFKDFEVRNNLRILNTQKTLTENMEKTRESDELMKNSIKHTEFRIKESFEQFQKKISEERYKEKRISESNINEIKQEIDTLMNKIDSIPTMIQIQTIITTTAEKLKDVVKQDIKDKVLKPEIQSLTQKVISLNSEYEGKFNLVNEKVRNLDEKVVDSVKICENMLNNNTKEIQKNQNEKNIVIYREIEKIYERFEYMEYVKKQFEQQTKESIMSFIAFKQSHSLNIKRFENGLQSCEDNIKNMQQSLIDLSQPKTPQSIYSPVIQTFTSLASPLGNFNYPSSPLQNLPAPAQAPIEIPLDDIYEKIFLAKQELTDMIKQEKTKTLEIIQDQVKILEIQREKNKNASEQAIQELKDKLAWLPISLCQLEGMTPGEARLFTIEARLRSEENSRIQSFNHLSKLVDNFINQKIHNAEFIEAKDIKTAINPINEINTNSRNSVIRKNSPFIGQGSSEWWKKAQESERRNCSESGSVIGKIKFSTPVPESDEAGDSYVAYKDRRKARAVPKSWDTETTQIPRIQTALPLKPKKSFQRVNKIY
ncbi:hypothetical protein SteCoe_17362 [Stentor coeruleus]|uniref:Uncharacterized protein n=1 Tax=Stentor coeruleus TaxID=5963 RepID=A0A1R2BZE3_9CILI|nr:hypothetical protein SteCoe_17362 [Stentor coeruleus]